MAVTFIKKRENNVKDVWMLVSFSILALYGIFLLYPIVRLFYTAFFSDGVFTFKNFVDFFTNSYYVVSIWHSLLIALAVTLISLLLGIPLAYFYQMYHIKGKSVLQILIMLCSMQAPFIGGYAWIDLFGRSGRITTFLKGFGVEMPTIYGFLGILIVESLQLFPTVYLYLCGALKNIDNSLLEASDNLGCSGFKRFLKVVIPLCVPTILAAALLVFMRSFSDYGTPLIIGEGYMTFPQIIVNSYFNEVSTNKSFGAAVAIVGIVVTTVIFLLQEWTNNKFKFTMNALHPVERKKAKGIFNVLIHLYCWIITLISFGPQIYVIYTAFLKQNGKLFVYGEYSLDSFKYAFSHLRNAIPNTFKIGLIALVLIVVLAVLVAYLIVRRNNAVNRVVDILSMIPYLIPGSVIGIALLGAFNKKPILLAGTAAIMIIALIIRRMPYTIRSSIAILQQIPMSIEEAAISLGTSKLKTFFTITLPMMANGVLSGAIMSWITIITELSTAVILYNLSTVTLTMAVYTYVVRGSYGYAAAYATILTLTTIISFVIFMCFSKDKEISV